MAASQTARMAERGSTLLELLVALAVLTIGIAGNARLLLLAVTTESQSQPRETANQRLADALEMLNAWNGSPPLARISEWRTAVRESARGAASGMLASLEALPTAGSTAARWRATLQWGSTPTQSISLPADIYAPARPP